MKAEEKIMNKKEMLFEAAIKEFSNKSFDDASLNDILKCAGISKGAFYYSFKDKKDLYTQLNQRVVHAKLEFLKGIQADKTPEAFLIQPDSMTIFGFIKSLTIKGLGFTQAHPEYYKFTTMYTKESEIFRKEIEGDQAQNTENFLNDMIQKAYEHGDIDKKYPVEFAKGVIIYTMTNYLEIVGFSDIDDMEKSFEELNLFYEFLERGFAPK